MTLATIAPWVIAAIPVALVAADAWRKHRIIQRNQREFMASVLRCAAEMEREMIADATDREENP